MQKNLDDKKRWTRKNAMLHHLKLDEASVVAIQVTRREAPDRRQKAPDATTLWRGIGVLHHLLEGAQLAAKT